MRTAGHGGTADEGANKPSKGRAPYRIKRWTHIERDLRLERGPLLAGVDEVGRGPIAGPVVACAVIMPPDMRAIREGAHAGARDAKAAEEMLTNLQSSVEFFRQGLFGPEPDKASTSPRNGDTAQ